MTNSVNIVFCFVITLGKVLKKKVVKPCISWKDAVEKLTSFSKFNFYTFCVVFLDNFHEVIGGKIDIFFIEIVTQLNSQKRKECEENRAIRPIIKTIGFCRELGIPLRDDDDSGPLS